MQTKLLWIKGAEFYIYIYIYISTAYNTLHLSHTVENMEVELFINFKMAYDAIKECIQKYFN